MAKARYLLVEGVDGHPVSDPHSTDIATGQIARYVGWQFAPQTVTVKIEGQIRTICDPDVDGLLDHYKPVRQVVKDHPDLRAAIWRQHLTMHGMVVARNHEDARGQFVRLGKLDVGKTPPPPDPPPQTTSATSRPVEPGGAS